MAIRVNREQGCNSADLKLMVYWFKEKNVEFIARDDSINAGLKMNVSKTNGMCNDLGKKKARRERW